MGQRHQFFLIARVRTAPGEPKKYCCVTAFHHQWCYGKVPLRCVNRFKHLARVKDNAALIQRDLDHYSEGVQRSPETPCPYITSLGLSAFSIDIEDQSGLAFTSGVWDLPANKGTKVANNNDGITVIDISIPGEPKYCFVSIYGLEAAGASDVPEDTPLTARQYLRAYYSENLDPLASDAYQQAEVYNIKAIEDLDDMLVVTQDVLVATWPDEYPASATSQIPSDLGDVEGHMPRPEGNALTKPGLVNLSRSDLPSSELLQALKDVALFTRLDISHNTTMDKATLAQIMTEHRLQWVNIDGCSISTEDIRDLLRSQAQSFRGVEAIIHPAFISLENFEGTSTGIPYTFRFHYIGRSPGCIALPFFSIDQLVQSLTDIVKNPLSKNDQLSIDHLHGLFGSSPRSDGRPWAERVVEMIAPKLAFSKTPEGYKVSEGCRILDERSYAEGYSFVFLRDLGSNWHLDRSFGYGYHYGVILPGGERKFVDVATFLRHLEENGWPKPENGQAVVQLIELFSVGITLLADFDAALDYEEAELSRALGSFC